VFLIVVQHTTGVCAHVTLAALGHGVCIKDVQKLAPIALLARIVKPKTTHHTLVDLFEGPFHFQYPSPISSIPFNETVSAVLETASETACVCHRLGCLQRGGNPAIRFVPVEQHIRGLVSQEAEFQRDTRGTDNLASFCFELRHPWLLTTA
jgi:hypothetical protein